MEVAGRRGQWPCFLGGVITYTQPRSNTTPPIHFRRRSGTNGMAGTLGILGRDLITAIHLLSDSSTPSRKRIIYHEPRSYLLVLLIVPLAGLSRDDLTASFISLAYKSISTVTMTKMEE